MAPPDTELFLPLLYFIELLLVSTMGVPPNWLGWVVNFSLLVVMGVAMLLTSFSLADAY